MTSPFAPLDPCVHCGFCLQACPTYLATGDESDSPRGRIVLMRGLERGEIAPDDPALLQHLDACLGCRGCEPVCPSGVGYGRGLEAAREMLVRHNGMRPLARLVLAVFGSKLLWRPVFWASRMLRNLGLPARLAGGSRLGFSMGMVAATEPHRHPERSEGPLSHPERSEGPLSHPERSEGSLIFSEQTRSGIPRSLRDLGMTGGSGPSRDLGMTGGSGPLRDPGMTKGPTVALFTGCVMDGLFAHVHEATRRTLTANGYRVVEVGSQVCCGALHEHAGDRHGAERLARQNLAAFVDQADYIVVNSAGCGALLKDYGHLLESADAKAFGTRVRDVTELLAEAGPRIGGNLALDVAYDAPCHLQHAQRVHSAPLKVLGAIPGLRLALLPGHDRCCGSAGIFSLLEPGMSRAVLDAKVESIRDASPRPSIIATGNPGCLMQIGAGLTAAGLETRVAHPVELLDWSYAAGGVYREVMSHES